MNEAATSDHIVSPWLLWFGLFGGLTAWILHLAIGFVIVLDGCALGMSYLRLTIGIVTAVLALIALAAALVAYRTWGRVDEAGDGDVGDRRGRIRFMAVTGVWLSGLALLIIVLLGIPVALLNPCA